jgi:hypothetical protein
VENAYDYIYNDSECSKSGQDYALIKWLIVLQTGDPLSNSLD